MPNYIEIRKPWPWLFRFPHISYRIGIAVLALSLLGFFGEGPNGFDLSQHSVPLEDIRSGGPPRDGIPAIINPHFVSVEDATFLQKHDRILGIQGKEESKAYPIKIMNWHEIVNDSLEGSPIVITYCPLCGTGMACSIKAIS